MPVSQSAAIATIIIPAFNRPERLRQCLASLCDLRGPAFAVIVVDDGSAQPLEPVCAEFAGRLAIRCHHQPNQGPGAARNAGAALAATPYLLFTDDDCRPRPGWLASMVAALEDSPTALVGGPVENGLHANPYAAASQDIQSFLYAADTSPLRFFASNNLACCAAAFAAIGGFSSRLRRASEDRELSLRWRAQGWPLAYVAHGVVDHYHALALASFWRQHFNYGRGAKDLAGLLGDGDSSSGPALRPRGAGFYLALVSHPLRQPGPWRLYRAALIAAAQLATAAGYYLKDQTGLAGPAPAAPAPPAADAPAPPEK